MRGGLGLIGALAGLVLAVPVHAEGGIGPTTVEIAWVSYRAWPSRDWAQPQFSACVAQIGLTLRPGATNDPRYPIREGGPDSILYLPFYDLPPLREGDRAWQRGGTVCITADGQWRAPEVGPYWYPAPGIGELLEKQESKPYPGQLAGRLAVVVAPNGSFPLRANVRQDVDLPSKDPFARALGGIQRTQLSVPEQVTVWLQKGVGEVMLRLRTWNPKTGRGEGPNVEVFLRATASHG